MSVGISTTIQWKIWNLNSSDNISMTDIPGYNADIQELNCISKVIIGVLMVLLIVVSFCGNSIVCLIVFQKPAMRSAINLLLANMAVSDILTSVTSMTFSFVTLFWREQMLTDVHCKFIMFFQAWFVFVGTVMLLTISVDRYMIIVQKKDKLVSHNARILIILAWISSIILTFPPTVGWGHYRYSPVPPQCILGDSELPSDVTFVILKVSITFFIPVFTMSFCFIRILNVFRKNRNRVHNQSEFTISVISNRERMGFPIVQKSFRSFRVNVDMSFKTCRAFKTIFVLFIAFFVCWTPHAVNTLLSIIFRDYNRTRNILFLWTGFTNSAINPIIYCIRIRKFREACRSILPDTFSFTGGCFSLAKRRINPSHAYRFSESSSI